MAAEQQKRNIVIIGGGIIGSTTAYYLTHHPSFDKSKHSITLLEATKIAGGASGKAGGLLALWAYPSCIVPLSYKLHAELAEKHNGAERWGYRGVSCGQLDVKGRMPGKRSGDSVSLKKTLGREGKGGEDAVAGGLKATAPKAEVKGVPKDLDWIASESLSKGCYEEMGDPSTTAQVHPYQFTTSMAQLAEEKGARIIYGSATSINQAEGAVTGVSYKVKDTGEEKTLEADTIILTAGPWTKEIWKKAPIEALRAHSVTIRPTRPVSAYCLFTSIDLPKTGSKRGKQTATPEIYARPNNEVYACGEGDTLIPLPSSTDLVQCDDARCQDIIDQVSSISDELRDGEVTARQACYLPNVSGKGGGPLVGETSVKGLFLGAGHTCWGIQNGPGTGRVLAELVWEGKVKSARVESLDPRRWGL